MTTYPDLARFVGRRDPEAVTVRAIMGVLAGISSTDEIWRDRDALMDAIDAYETITTMADDPAIQDEILSAIALYPTRFPLAHMALAQAAEQVREHSAEWLADHDEADRADNAIAMKESA